MECRCFMIYNMSACGLENVREMFQVKVYAVISIAGNQRTERRTPVDKENETNPNWGNWATNYTIGETAVQQEGVMLDIKLYCKRTLGDRYIGEVRTSIKYLYQQANASDGSVMLTCNVKKGGAVSQGQLKFSCRFAEKVIIEQEAKWKKILKTGAIEILRVAALGVGLPFDVNVFIGEDINYGCGS
ncbi:hypothetical protein NMG60_11035714 [Bertholletia excelsa]